jgi:hypothetical protein
VVIGLLICLSIFTFELQRKHPVPIKLAFVDDSQLQERYIADTWIESHTVYDDGSYVDGSTDRFPIMYQLAGEAKSLGRNSYSRIRVPINFRGGIPLLNEVAVKGTVDIYIGFKDAVSYVGSVSLTRLAFIANSRVGVYDSWFWVCGDTAYNRLISTHEGVSDANWQTAMVWSSGLYAIRYQTSYGNCFINIQNWLDSYKGGATDKTGTIYMYAVVNQRWLGSAYPFFTYSELKNQEIIFDFPFDTKPSTTITGTTVSTAAPTGTFTVTDQTVIYSISYTYSRVSTEYPFRTATLTVPPTAITTGTTWTTTLPTPIPLDIWNMLRDWFMKLVKENTWIMLVLILFAALLGLIVLLLIVKALRWASPTKKKN